MVENIIDCLWEVQSHPDEGIFVVNNNYGWEAATKELSRYCEIIRERDGTDEEKKFLDLIYKNKHYKLQNHIFRYLWMSGELATHFSPTGRSLLLPSNNDIDGNLSLKRIGDGENGYFSEENAASWKETTDYGGIIFLSTAMHDMRCINLLEGRMINQVDAERTPVAIENGQKILLAYLREEGSSGRKYDYVLLEKGVTDEVKTVNKMLSETLIHLGEECYERGLFMFPNLDKSGKVTLEMMTNGVDANRAFLSQIVIPYLKKELNLDIQQENATGDFFFSYLGVRFRIGITKDSGEFDNAYMATKSHVHQIIRNAYVRKIHERYDSIEHGQIITHGSGDAPSSSDSGIATFTGGTNLGIYTNPMRVKTGGRLLVDIIQNCVRKDYGSLTLPFFSQDGQYQLANADVVTQWLWLLRQGVNCARIVGKRSLDAFKDEFIKEAASDSYQVVRDTRESSGNPRWREDAEWADRAMQSKQPYTLPPYLAGAKTEIAAFFEGKPSEDFGNKILKIKDVLSLN